MTKPKTKTASSAVPQTIGALALDSESLNGQRVILYQVAGIMALAIEAIRETHSEQQIEWVLAAIDAAHTLLVQTIETIMADSPTGLIDRSHKPAKPNTSWSFKSM